MHYSRAGLVTLVFALIVSLVSAVPIPATTSTESGLSSTLNGQDHFKPDVAKIAKIPFSGRMSTLPAAIRALTREVRYCLSSYVGSVLPSYSRTNRPT